MTFAERIGNEGTEERYNFFKGRIYPTLVAIAVFIGYAFELEFYSNIVILTSAIAAMLTTDSLKPIILPLLTYLYQVPLAHAPGHPTFSDFYSAPGRLAVIVIMFLLVAAALIFSSVKNRFFTPYGVLHAPFLVPSVILSLAFLLNGVLGGEHTLSGLGYGALQIVTFFVIFYFFYFGLANERGDELVGYVVKTSTKGKSKNFVMMTGVTVDGRINNLSVVSQAETAGYVNKAASVFEGLVGKDAQTQAEVDAVSNATKTSNAVLAGARLALETVKEVQANG